MEPTGAGAMTGALPGVVQTVVFAVKSPVE